MGFCLLPFAAHTRERARTHVHKHTDTHRHAHVSICTRTHACTQHQVSGVRFCAGAVTGRLFGLSLRSRPAASAEAPLSRPPQHTQSCPGPRLWLCLESAPPERNVSCFALWKEMQTRPCPLAGFKRSTRPFTQDPSRRRFGFISTASVRPSVSSFAPTPAPGG